MSGMHASSHLANPRGRALRRALTAAVVVAALGTATWVGIKKWRGGDEAPSYTTVAVSRGDVVQAVTASGTLSPVVTVEVGSQVSGRIKELLVDYNAEVKAGQVIARIDPQLFESAVSQASARLASARADVTRTQAVATNAKAQHQRNVELVTAGVISAADVDASLAAWKSADSQVVSAKAGLTEALASLDQAKVNLAYTTIASPIDGIVVSRSVDVGQTVAASLSAPTLFVIAEDLRRMEVHTSVAESDVGQLAAGMRVEFTVDAFPDSFEGTVKQVRYEAQTVSNVVTYDAVVEVANDALKLRPGMTATATFVIDERKNALLVANKALRYRPPGAEAEGERAGRGQRGAGGGRGRRGRGAEGAGSAAPGSAAADVAAAGAPPAGSATAGAPAPAASAPDADAPRGRGNRGAVWVLRDGAPVRVRLEPGLSDGSMTEIVGGELVEGDLVITGDGSTAAAGAARPPQQQPRRGVF